MSHPSSLSSLRLSALGMFAALVVGSCGSASTGGAPGGGDAKAASGGSDDVLRVALYHWPASLNPHFAPTAVDFDLYHQVFEGLVDVDPKQKLVGRLAESFEASADGKVLTFHLRKGVTWHDGKPFTARDVLFTFKSLTTWADLSYRPLMTEVESIDAKGDHTVVVKYKQPFAPALSTWTVPVLPAHHFPEGTSYEEASAKFPGVGTGPYRIAATSEGESITLERHAGFQRPVPFFGKIVFKLMKDATASVVAIKTGELDVVRMRHPDFDLKTVKGDWEPIMQRLRCPTYGYSFVGWNQDGSNPFFEDRRIRRALALAFDREQARQMYTSSLAELSWGPYPQGSVYFDPTLMPIPIDSVSASRELDMTGFIDHDGDGYRDRDGVMLRIKLLVLEGMLFGNEIAYLMIEDFKAVGVKLEPVRVTYPEMMKRIQEGDFQAFLLEWSGDVDPDLYPLFHSSQHRKGLNYVGYVNPEVDALLVEGRRTVDPAKRQEIYRKLHALVYADQPYLFLFHMPSLWGHSTRLEGVEPQFGGLLTAHPGLLLWRSTRPPVAMEPKATPTAEEPPPSTTPEAPLPPGEPVPSPSATPEEPR